MRCLGGYSMKILTYLLLFVFVSIPQLSSAEEYYWYRNGYSQPFPTAQAVCDFYKGSFSIPSWRPNDTHITNTLVNWNPANNSVGCRNASQPSDTNVNTYIIHRGGDSCPPGHTENETGHCTPPPGGQTCEREGEPTTGLGFITNAEGACVDWNRADLPSQCKSLSGRTGPANVNVTFDDDGNPQNPPPINRLGCEAVAYGVSQCKKKPVQ